MKKFLLLVVAGLLITSRLWNSQGGEVISKDDVCPPDL